MPKLKQDFVPAGTVLDYAGFTAPTGFLMMDGSSYSRTTYARLYNILTVSKGTVTITEANPGVVTLNTHGLATGDNIELTTTGTLPTNLTANTNYFVIYNNANSFWLATSWANAQAATKINTTGAIQAGTHSLRFTPFGIDTAASFKVADARGLFVRTAGTHGSQAKAAGGNYAGGNVGAFEQDKGQGHYHSITDPGHVHALRNTSVSASGAARLEPNPTVAGNDVNVQSNTTGITVIAGSTDGTNGTPRTGNESKPASLSLNKIIKY
jgi:hypothetical protein